ncbi:hypothetical protein FA95DRAFT_1548610 [Auriscalpium vulgare]|uniref:Uncharacterized protein n=1 Tax=Auriscalpium vulgare TaxID=40419 RepID=A0ACB8RBS7_9AGAM|nr:hypothetical protein FA95DRAFT_1548610 [Auriscalpium vulgare]
MAPLVLASLPLEIVLRFLELSDLNSLITCRQVCRALQTAIDGSSLLQYHILMAATGVHDGNSELTVSEKLAKLKAYDEAWQNGLWTEHTQSPMPQNPLWELYGGISASGGDRMLTFKQLPSRLRGIEAREWELTFDFVIRDFGLDASQDLLVVVERFTEGPLCRVHLRQLSTGQPHPLGPTSGQLPINKLLGETWWYDWTYSIRVSGDYVGVLFSNDDGGETELYIWNWRTGAVQLLVASETQAYTFLGDIYVLVGVLHRPVLEEDKSSLIVYNLLEPRVVNDTPQGICTFQLPKPAFELDITADPAPQWSPPAESVAPFFVAHTDRLIAVNIQFRQRWQPRTRTYLLRSQDLLPYLLPSGDPTGQTRIIPWEDWKHACQRVEHGRWTSWTCFVYGMRYVSPRPVVMDGVRMVRILDFHPLRTRRASPGQDGDERTNKRLRVSAKVVALPRALQKAETIDFMISEDTIVAIESDVSGVERSIHLLTF